MIGKILRRSLKPYNIIFPFPLLPAITGVFAGGIYGLWKPVMFTFLFYPANNLWNHINDAEDDFEGGGDSLFINDDARKLGTLIASFLYMLSALFVLLVSKSKISLILFLLVFAVTFLYSDKAITGLRLKKHYLTELLVYITAVPSYILLMYSLVKGLDLTSIKIAVLFTPLMLSTLFIKDLKDISSDMRAGLKTFGVVFHYKTLIKAFYFLLLTYFLLSIFFFYDDYKLASFLPVFAVIYSMLGMKSRNWSVSEKTQKYINLSIMSGLLSVSIMLAILIIGSFAEL